LATLLRLLASSLTVVQYGCECWVLWNSSQNACNIVATFSSEGRGEESCVPPTAIEKIDVQILIRSPVSAHHGQPPIELVHHLLLLLLVFES
jgi:hypothetical protein